MLCLIASNRAYTTDARSSHVFQVDPDHTAEEVKLYLKEEETLSRESWHRYGESLGSNREQVQEWACFPSAFTAIATMLTSWMIIGAVTLLVALAANLFRPRGAQWFNRQQRPHWLTFEKLIPLIWTIIFICVAWSAYIVWEHAPDSNFVWFLMAFYLLLELVTVAYTPLNLGFRSFTVGTYVGAIGFILGLILTLLVVQISGWAALLLLPYLLWSPISSYTTWKIDRLNSDA